MKLGVTVWDPGFTQKMVSKFGSRLPRNQDKEKHMSSYEILSASKIKQNSHQEKTCPKC